MKSELLMMALLCQAVYIKDDRERVTRFHELGCACLAWLDNNGTQAVLLQSYSKYFLVFRGTDEPKDWLKDVDVRKTETPFGKVHNGFNEGVLAIWNDLVDALQGNRVLSVTVCGHSKGAGEALIAAEWLQHLYSSVRKAYLFGCPRAKGVAAPAPYFPISRVVNNNDVICRVPTPWRFRHFGQRYYISHKGDLVKGVTPWKIFKDRLSGRWASRNLLDGLSDHPIDKYVKALT